MSFPVVRILVRRNCANFFVVLAIDPGGALSAIEVPVVFVLVRGWLVDAPEAIALAVLFTLASLGHAQRILKRLADRITDEVSAFRDHFHSNRVDLHIHLVLFSKFTDELMDGLEGAIVVMRLIGLIGRNVASFLQGHHNPVGQNADFIVWELHYDSSLSSCCWADSRSCLRVLAMEFMTISNTVRPAYMTNTIGK